MTRKNGFTLAEILVVIAIIAVIGTIMVAIFINTLRGSNKSQVLSVIKQNGQSVLENMDKVIRGADKVVCISTLDNNTLVVKNSDETGKVTYTRFRLIRETPTANGLIQQDNPVKQIVSGVEETDLDFTNRVCFPDDPMPQANVFTDTNTRTGVSTDSDALFTIEPTTVSNNTVTVKFELAPAIGAPAAINNQIDPVTFQTTIKLRNS